MEPADDRARIDAEASAGEGGPVADAAGRAGRPHAPFRWRDLTDDLIFLLVLVLFVKMFVVELYKIPSGSMTPTLIGGLVAYVDANGDGKSDLLYWDQPEGLPHVFVKDAQSGRYIADESVRPTGLQIQDWAAERRMRHEFDRILVNKMAYFFRAPRRGEIVIFKVSRLLLEMNPGAPIYIKRLAGEPGESLSFSDDGRLVAGGKLVDTPDFYRTQQYQTEVDTGTSGFVKQSNVTYAPDGFRRVRIERIAVPAGEAYVFGDNTRRSLDSRYWGGVPLPNIKGRAFFRIMPFGRFGGLD